LCPRAGWTQGAAPQGRSSFGKCRRGCALRSLARRANSRPEGMPRRRCRLPPFPKVYPAGGLLYGRGISRPSVRSSIGSGPPGAASALAPESAPPYKTSSISGRIRSKRRVS